MTLMLLEIEWLESALVLSSASFVCSIVRDLVIVFKKITN